jgi:hypothetical protein
MYFQYGNYRHADNEVDLTTMIRKPMYSPRNRLTFTRDTMTVYGHFCVTGQDNIKDKIDELEAAYLYDFEDAGLYHDDGTRSPHWMDTSLAINGVRVKSLDYPQGGGAEYATGRTYRIVLEADYFTPESDLYAFNESIRFEGTTGPKWELVPQYLGPPIARLIFSQTPQRIIQQGTKITTIGWPAMPTPVLPANYEHTDLRMVEMKSPLLQGRVKNMLYPMQYRYVFSSVSPQILFPSEG